MKRSLSLSLVEAKAVADQVPDHLPALKIFEREANGSLVRVCAVGDIGLSGRAALTAERTSAEALFEEVSSVLQEADISFGNLESPLASKIAPGKMFAGPVSGAFALQRAGFDLLHLANNHIADHGQAGLAETLTALQSAGIAALGAGNDVVSSRQLIRMNLNGLSIGWLGCGRTLLTQRSEGPVYWEFNEENLLAAVREARDSVDVLVVSIHIGFMYLDYPSPEHKELAERLMDNGAHLILMHHAHVLQGVQLTSEGRVCCYNLGNFVYDWEEGNVIVPVMVDEQNESAIFVFDFDKQGIAAATALPIWIDKSCSVRWATGDRGHRILDRLARISRDIEGDLRLRFEQQRASRNTAAILKVLVFNLKSGNWQYVINCVRRTRWEHLRMLGRWLTGVAAGCMG